MTSKEQLYYLIHEYIKDNYDTKTFCDQFTIIFNIETDYEDLNEVENKLFLELSSVTTRFSPYEKDFVFQNVYYTEQEVKREVLEIKRKLNSLKK